MEPTPSTEPSFTNDLSIIILLDTLGQHSSINPHINIYCPKNNIEGSPVSLWFHPASVLLRLPTKCPPWIFGCLFCMCRGHVFCRSSTPRCTVCRQAKYTCPVHTFYPLGSSLHTSFHRARYTPHIRAFCYRTIVPRTFSCLATRTLLALISSRSPSSPCKLNLLSSSMCPLRCVCPA